MSEVLKRKLVKFIGGGFCKEISIVCADLLFRMYNLCSKHLLKYPINEKELSRTEQLACDLLIHFGYFDSIYHEVTGITYYNLSPKGKVIMEGIINGRQKELFDKEGNPTI